MKAPLTILAASLLLAACNSPAPRPDSGVQPPAAWQSPEHPGAVQSNRQWWTQFGSPELDRLVEQARVGSHDLGAAVARVRQAQASATIAGAPLLPEIKAGLNANRQKLLHGKGYSQLDVSPDNRSLDYYDAELSASYEIDFWGGKRAARDSAVFGVQASEFDRATVELTLQSGVANSYTQALALREQARIAELNLANAQNVLHLVQTRFDAGSATAGTGPAKKPGRRTAAQIATGAATGPRSLDHPRRPARPTGAGIVGTATVIRTVAMAEHRQWRAQRSAEPASGHRQRRSQTGGGPG